MKAPITELDGFKVGTAYRTYLGVGRVPHMFLLTDIIVSHRDKKLKCKSLDTDEIFYFRVDYYDTENGRVGMGYTAKLGPDRLPLYTIEADWIWHDL